MSTSNHALPLGKWKVRSNLQAALKSPHATGDREEDPPKFILRASDSVTSDLVQAEGFVGDLQELSLDDWGLPRGVPENRIWRLGYFTPRTPKATGGTKALISWICAQADQLQAWLLVEVQPIDPSREAGIVSMMERYGFESFDSDAPHVMRRSPLKTSGGKPSPTSIATTKGGTDDQDREPVA